MVRLLHFLLSIPVSIDTKVVVVVLHRYQAQYSAIVTSQSHAHTLYAMRRSVHGAARPFVSKSALADRHDAEFRSQAFT